MDKIDRLRFMVLFAYRMGLFERDLFWYLWEACSPFEEDQE